MTAQTENRKSERKTSGVRQKGRPARVVSSVLKATAEELSRVGYSALRIDEVAKCAGVNKTTIYRRWPSKAELVSDTILNSLKDTVVPDTGNLRSDLLEHFSSIIKRSKQPQWRGILMTLNSHVDPEIESLAQELRTVSRKRRATLVQKGVDRGELPKQVDVELVADIVAAPILYRVLHEGKTVDKDYIESILDVVLTGAASSAIHSSRSQD